MPAISIEQAIYRSADNGGYRLLARSPGFRDDWLAAAEHLCIGFGERPAGVACPYAVFAQPLDPQHIAVVQVADQDNAVLGFHLLVLPRKAYAWIGDPFAIAERCPPPWNACDQPPALSWPPTPLPRRTVAQVQHILKEGDSPTLLGAVQALIDGGRIVFERPAPAADLVRQLWQLLPDRTRCELWPASFAFGNALGFHVLVLPRIASTAGEGYLTEEQAGDYPQGRYELNLQIAAESGDQPQLDALFARRSSTDMLRLALILVVVFVALAAVMRLLDSAAPRPPATQKTAVRQTPPLAEHYPRMKQEERAQVGAILKKLFQERGLALPSPNPRIEEMLAALDKQLGTPDPQRRPGPLGDVAPHDTEKQLRLLLWKQHVTGFDDPQLNPVELAERLYEKLQR